MHGDSLSGAANTDPAERIMIKISSVALRDLNPDNDKRKNRKEACR